MAIGTPVAGTIAHSDSLVGTTGHTPGLPAGTVEDDFLLLISHRNDDSGTFDTPSGWNKIDALSSDDWGQPYSSLVAWRYAPSSPAAPTVTHSDTGAEQWSSVILGWSGVKLVTPFDVTPAAAHVSTFENKVSGTNVDVAPPITTVTDGAEIICAEIITHDDITSSVTPVPTMTNRVWHVGADIDFRQIIVDTLAQVSAATFTPTAAAYESNAGIADSTHVTLALRPAPATFTLDVDSGAYLVTGTAASLELNAEVQAASGAYLITGTAAALELNAEIQAASGTFLVTGTAATLTQVGTISVAIKVHHGALPVGTGTFDLTNAGLGQPKAAIVSMSYGTVAGTAATHGNMSYGFTDGTTHRFGSINDKDGVGTTDVHGICGLILGELCTPGTGTIEVALAFDSFITDGIRIDQTTASGNQELYTVILFYGADVSAHVQSQSAGGSVDEVVDITTVGFKPDVVLVQYGSKTRYNVRTQSAGWVQSIGWSWNNSGTYVQRTNMAKGVTGLGASEITGYYAESYAGGSPAAPRLEINAFDSSGFSCTARGTGAAGLDFAWLALKFNDKIALWAGSLDTPTSTGNSSTTLPGFKPQACLSVGSLSTTVDTLNSDAEAGSLAFGAMDDTIEGGVCITVEDGEGTSDTQSMADAKILNVPDDDGTDGYEASHVSFDTNGFTINYDTVLVSARKTAWLAFGEVVVVTDELGQKLVQTNQSITRASSW